MDWKMDEDKLVAQTDFGRYEIAMKSRANRTFSVALHGGDAVHSMEGEYDTVAAAQRAALTDLEYRQNMWETL